MRLEGKTALVTGGARGIGRAISVALARDGAQVAVLDQLRDGARETAGQIEALGTKALALGGGGRDAGPVGSGRHRREQRGVGPDGVLPRQRGGDLGPHHQHQLQGRSLRPEGDAAVDREARPGRQGRQHRVGRRTRRLDGRGGLRRHQGGDHRLLEDAGPRAGALPRVVCPGLTETPLLQSIREQSDRTAKVIEAVTRGIPLERVGRPEEIADAVRFLVSPEADFITGQTLSVSGGLTMC